MRLPALAANYGAPPNREIRMRLFTKRLLLKGGLASPVSRRGLLKHTM